MASLTVLMAKDRRHSAVFGLELHPTSLAKQSGPVQSLFKGSVTTLYRTHVFDQSLTFSCLSQHEQARRDEYLRAMCSILIIAALSMQWRSLADCTAYSQGFCNQGANLKLEVRLLLPVLT